MRTSSLSECSDSKEPRKPFTIAIIGGGLAGLILAAGLSARGIRVCVYEAKAFFSELSAGISISPNAFRAMRRVDRRVVDIYERIRTGNASADKQDVWFQFRRGESEDLDLVWPVRIDPDENGNLHRGRFLSELARLLPEDNYRLNKSLVALDEEQAEGVRVHFADGSSAVADAVVGCDGIHSTVRRIVLNDAPGAQPEFTGVYAYRGVVEMSDAISALGPDLAQDSQVYMGHGGNVVTYPIDEGQRLNVVAFRKHESKDWNNEKWVEKASSEQLLGDYRGWAAPVLRLLEHVKTSNAWGIYDLPPCPTYSLGRILLLGDAAHASTAHAGAGAGVGIEDALVLCEILSHDGVASAAELPAAFAVYDRMRRPRTQRLVRHSRELGEMFQFRMPGVGDDIAKVRERLEGVNEWVWDFDLDQHVKDAHEALSKELARGIGWLGYLYDSLRAIIC